MRQAIEVSKMQGRGGFRALRRDGATQLVDQAVREVLGEAALPHLVMIAAALEQPRQPAAKKYLRRFGITPETLADLERALGVGYQLTMRDHNQVDHVLTVH
ncbi:MAG: hypothetical protein M3R24_14265 [Chloroflexota bacterium]|nr:hypothetical protein [Chloroflexota bacterium]